MQQVAECLPIQVCKFGVRAVLSQPRPGIFGALAVQLPVEMLLNSTELYPVDLYKSNCNIRNWIGY